MDLTELKPMLEVFVTANYCDGAQLTELQVMEAGHAGLTNGFKVIDSHGGVIDDLVMKMAPKGVRRTKFTDIFRQAPLLRGLRSAGVRCPAIRWASDSEEEFGVPYIMMERVDGREFLIWDPHPSFARDKQTVSEFWKQAIELMVTLHDVDWRDVLAGWEEPRELREEVVSWNRILLQSPDPKWVMFGEEIEAMLLEELPTGGPIGLVHGDFQPGNILFSNGEAKAIVDWDLTSIGNQLIDLGWAMMCADPRAWHAESKPVFGLSPKEMQSLYEQHRGRPFDHVPWFHAFACYRMGSISCQGVNLHRKGQRHDPIWETMALSIPVQFTQAKSILNGR